MDRVTQSSPRPRIVLGPQHLSQIHPVWTLGNDPFAWEPGSDGEDESAQSTQSEAFVRLLENRSSFEDRDSLREAVLGPGSG